jgi:hypothetical protein
MRGWEGVRMPPDEATRRSRERTDERGRPWWSLLVGPVLVLAGCASGEYRMPYEDGTQVWVENDHVTHGSPRSYMYDLEARNASPAEVVAAAPGWIRWIEDGNQEPTNENNFVWIEHPYPFCPVRADRSNWPGKPANYDATCIPCGRDFCNEWTTYAHLTKDSVRGIAGLSVGDWVEAGDFLGFEDAVGVAYGVHLHWHVSVMPPTAFPICNGHYLPCDTLFDAELSELPELIPIVCHQDGRSVLWRTGRYTAGDCAAQAPPRGGVVLQGQLRGRSPLDAIIQRVARITDEGIQIALADPQLMSKTQRLMMQLEPDFRDLVHLGRARITEAELKMVLDLAAEYEARGSTRVQRVVGSIRRQLESGAERQTLGLIVERPLEGLD